jgi:chemotaxis protein methyltransferase CheR
VKTISSLVDPVYQKVAELMETRTGLVFDSQQYPEVETGVRKTMSRLHINDSAEFLRRLETEQSCLDELAAELTVGETYFFREPAQFQWIRENILPEIFSRCGKDHLLRAWSAGCSSGEEAYSLAILFEEAGLADYAKIRATDISLSALLKARKAVYRRWSFRGREDRWMEHYFHLGEEQYTLDKRFRRKVEFEYLNLAGDGELGSFPRAMDLILCRNVMIYFGGSTVAGVFRKLIDSLAPGGWLVTGPSDPLFEDRSQCEMITTGAGAFYRKFSTKQPAEFSDIRETPVFELPKPAARPFEKTASEILSMAQEAFYRGTHESASSYNQDVAACQLSIRAMANLQGEDAAEQAAEKAVRLHPLSPELRFLRAVLLVNLGRDREAVRDFRRTLYLDGTLAVAHFALGSVLRRLRDFKGAILAYENALCLCGEMPPESPLPLSDGESAGHLREAAQTQLSLLLNRPPETGREK